MLFEYIYITYRSCFTVCELRLTPVCILVSVFVLKSSEDNTQTVHLLDIT